MRDVPTNGISTTVKEHSPPFRQGAQKKELAARSVSLDGSVLDSGVCWQAFFKNPNGNTLAIHHRYAPPDAMPGSWPRPWVSVVCSRMRSVV